jgi:hypothetical protein
MKTILEYLINKNTKEIKKKYLFAEQVKYGTKKEINTHVVDIEYEDENFLSVKVRNVPYDLKKEDIEFTDGLHAYAKGKNNLTGSSMYLFDNENGINLLNKYLADYKSTNPFINGFPLRDYTRQRSPKKYAEQKLQELTHGN